jgi:hypothetical protein
MCRLHNHFSITLRIIFISMEDWSDESEVDNENPMAPRNSRIPVSEAFE